MRKQIHITSSLSIPVDIATSTTSIIAVRGAGKTYTGAVLAEELIGAHVQTVITDPTGVWWGLRSSADGKSAGLPVVVMGGNHGDVPLESTAGEVVAEFVVESGHSVILDLSLMRKGEQKRFMTHFAEHLYHLKAQTKYQTPLHMIMDEADRFAPQKPQPEFARLLGAIEDIVRLGRSRGFGITTITQRSAVLNKDVLTQTETLIVLRTTSPQDRKAMNEWVKENATEEERDKVMKSLAAMPNGTAWIWSPQFLGVLKQVKIRTRRTFNSSATPKVGEKRREPKKMADIDLVSLKGKISESIERAKANDPKELQRRVAALQAELSKKKPAAAPAPKTRIKEVYVLRNKDIRRLEKVASNLHKGAASALVMVEKLSDLGKMAGGLHTVASDANTAIDKIRQLIDFSKTIVPHAKDEIARQEQKPSVIGAKVAPFYKQDLLKKTQSMVAAGKPLPKAEAGQPATNGKLLPTHQRILNALAWAQNTGLSPADKTQLAFLAGQSPRSGGYKNNLGKLRSGGYITYPVPGQVSLTEQGLAAAEIAGTPTSTAELQEQILANLVPAKRKIVEVMIEVYPQQMSRADLAERVGQSATSGGFKNYLGNLHSLKILDKSEIGFVRASKKLFLEVA